MFKDLLKEDAVEFYCQQISDDTIIKNQKWKDLKKTVMESDYSNNAQL